MSIIRYNSIFNGLPSDQQIKEQFEKFHQDTQMIGRYERVDEKHKIVEIFQKKFDGSFDSAVKKEMFLEVRESNIVKGENSLYTTKSFNEGDLIFVLDGSIFNEPTKYTIHIGNNCHVYDLWGIYMNHSFNPTTQIIGSTVVAAKNIDAGNELTFNYNDSEINMSCPFEVDGHLVSGNTL
jgi:hypothetical protein